MSKKFIGGGFPGIKDCINEKNILTKESKEKREFSVRKLIPINKILATRHKNLYDEILNQHQNKHQDKQQINELSLSDDINFIDSIKYNSISNLLHDQNTENIKINKKFDINLINAPIIRHSNKRTSRESTSRKRTSRKRTSRKRTSNKRTSNKRTSRKRTSNKRTSRKRTSNK